MIKKIKSLLISFLLIFPLASFAAEDSTQLAAILNNLHTMQANFSQTIVDGRGNAIQQTAGQMALERPGKFRWDTQTPNHQLLIADGSRVWFYDVDLQQVTVQKQRNIQANSPAMLLDGTTDSLMHDFSVKKISTVGPVTQIFDLQPKGSNGLFKSVQLVFNNNQLQAMHMNDNLGQTTNIQFSQVQMNSVLAPKLFAFKTPQGVDVVNQ